MKNLIRKFIPQFLINPYHFSMALLGAILYQFPSKKLKVIAVTGTNGKSTTVELITKILEEAGHEVAALSSVKFKIGKRESSNNLRMTMPGRLIIQKFLRQAADASCSFAVLEVTSEGIKQHRHRFINFDTAVLTNLTPEHIESHGGFENYKKAKGRLFEATKNVHIINLDDENADYFLQFSSQQKFCYGLNNNFKIESLEIDWKLKIENCKFIKAENVNISSSGINFKVENTAFRLNLLGGFNVYNALAAICVGLSQDISLETAKRALENAAGVPGRMELVIQEPFKVFVDYAFTPNALQKVYETLSGNCKLICVLGSAGGGRDKWKRPVLGEIAAKYCQEIIITNEDPYDENPMEIIEQVAAGTKGKANKVVDRREAINEALGLAKQGDVVVITGKGCEPSICIAGGKKIPWDDREVVREEFSKLKR